MKSRKNKKMKSNLIEFDHDKTMHKKFKHFLEGMASISLFPTLTSYSDITGGKTDEELIAQDWAFVLHDVDTAIEKVVNDAVSETRTC